MTTIRPGTPVTVTDEYLAAILVELRTLNARLAQDVVITTTDTLILETHVEEVSDPQEGSGS